MENPIGVEVFQALQRHDDVGLDVPGSEKDVAVPDDHLQIGVHVVEDETDVRFVPEDIQQTCIII